MNSRQNGPFSAGIAIGLGTEGRDTPARAQAEELAQMAEKSDTPSPKQMGKDLLGALGDMLKAVQAKREQSVGISDELLVLVRRVEKLEKEKLYLETALHNQFVDRLYSLGEEKTTAAAVDEKRRYVQVEEEARLMEREGLAEMIERLDPLQVGNFSGAGLDGARRFLRKVAELVRFGRVHPAQMHPVMAERDGCVSVLLELERKMIEEMPEAVRRHYQGDRGGAPWSIAIKQIRDRPMKL